MAREQIRSSELPRITPWTLTTWPALAAELDSIREVGLAVSRAEFAPSMACVATLVTTDSELPPVAVSVAGPSTDVEQEEVGPLLRRAAYAMSRRLQPRAAQRGRPEDQPARDAART